MTIIQVCPNCGQQIQDDDKFCEHCGANVPPAAASARAPPPPPPPPAPPAGSPPPPPPPSAAPFPAAAAGGEKNVLIAGGGSFLFVGLGQVYNGQFGKGLLLLGAALVGSLLVVPGLLVWVYSIYDAYRTAKKMNAGEVPFVAHNWTHIIGFIVIGIIVVALFNIFLSMISGFFYETAYGYEDYYGETDYCSPWDPDC